MPICRKCWFKEQRVRQTTWRTYDSSLRYDRRVQGLGWIRLGLQTEKEKEEECVKVSDKNLISHCLCLEWWTQKPCSRFLLYRQMSQSSQTSHCRILKPAFLISLDVSHFLFRQQQYALSLEIWPIQSSSFLSEIMPGHSSSQAAKSHNQGLSQVDPRLSSFQTSETDRIYPQIQTPWFGILGA